MRIEIWAEGLVGVGGDGGWGAIVRAVDDNFRQLRSRELSGGEVSGDGGRMDLLGVLEGLFSLKRSSEVFVITASPYVLAGRRRRGKVYANRELWYALAWARSFHEQVWFEPMESHFDDGIAERCQDLAELGRRSTFNVESGPVPEVAQDRTKADQLVQLEGF